MRDSQCFPGLHTWDQMEAGFGNLKLTSPLSDAALSHNSPHWFYGPLRPQRHIFYFPQIYNQVMISRGLPLGHMTLGTGIREKSLMSVQQGRRPYYQATQMSVPECSGVSALATGGVFGFTFRKTSRSSHKIWKSNPNPRQIFLYTKSWSSGKNESFCNPAEASKSTPAQYRLCPMVMPGLLHQQQLKTRGVP